MHSGYQTTLREPATVRGLGVHSNAPACIVIRPAPVNSGISFLRAGPGRERGRLIEARWNNVTTTELCTVIGGGADASVSTIEHLLSALAGLGVDNALVEIDGPEVPIMDGSACEFVAAMDTAGIVEQSAARRFLKVLKPVRVEQGGAFAELTPGEDGLTLDVAIDFAAGVIGRQSKRLRLTPRNFRRELARARTFGFLRDVERLTKMGFALGATLENTVAVDGERVLNPGGLRYADEFVRHKMLDAVGDLALAGAPLIGRYRSFRGGHRLNFMILEALFADRKAFAWVGGEIRPDGARAEAKFGLRPAFAEAG